MNANKHQWIQIRSSRNGSKNKPNSFFERPCASIDITYTSFQTKRPNTCKGAGYTDMNCKIKTHICDILVTFCRYIRRFY